MAIKDRPYSTKKKGPPQMVGLIKKKEIRQPADGRLDQKKGTPQMVGLISADESTNYWLETKQEEVGTPYFINEVDFDIRGHMVAEGSCLRNDQDFSKFCCSGGIDTVSAGQAGYLVMPLFQAIRSLPYLG